jgi:hypothetical protein
VDELPLEVEATDFQGGNFAYTGQAALQDRSARWTEEKRSRNLLRELPLL